MAAKIHYVGVDIAGASNTWFTSLSPTESGLEVAVSPHKACLAEIIHFVESNDVVAVCIDAQLTMSPMDEKGFRSSDVELQNLLPREFRCWVASINSLKAVPVRGRLLADSVAASVATVIETHPRASLLFGTLQSHKDSIENYKKGTDVVRHTQKLWDCWSKKFAIDGKLGTITDGALDSIVCATVGYLCHKKPECLHRLRHIADARVGHGPFYVISPDDRSACKA